MNILVTGGAGYIGSVVANLLEEKGYTVGVIDSLENGHRATLNTRIHFFKGDVSDFKFTSLTLEKFVPDAIMHFAAHALVEESFSDPVKYYQNNVVGSLNLFSLAMSKHVKHHIFSSSCAVYGIPDKPLIDEKQPTSPINPYGETKLVTERMLEYFGKKYLANTCSLRYFNVAGTDQQYGIGEQHHPETHLIPNIFLRALSNEPIKIFGSDYPTPDGTCIRDYIHVTDVATAHIQVLEYMLSRDRLNLLYNIGTGRGYSNLQIVDAVSKLTGHKVSIDFKPRRDGDPPVLIADAKKIEHEIGFTPKYSSLDSIISTHFNWLKKHKAHISFT